MPDKNRQFRYSPPNNSDKQNQQTNNEISAQSEFTPQMTIESIRYRKLQEVARCENKLAFVGGLDSYLVIKSPDIINQLEYQQAKSIKMFSSQSYSINQISWVCVTQRNEAHRPSSNDKDLLTCNYWEIKEHRSWVEEDSGDISFYICTMWRLKNLDPFSIPVAVLAGPFKINNTTWLKREFHVHNNLEALINNSFKNESWESWQSNTKPYQTNSSDIPNSNTIEVISTFEVNNPPKTLQKSIKGKIQVQLRWMKLNRWSNLEKDYENAFPKFSDLWFNGSFKRTYKVDPPPNHEKKRRDEMVNLSEHLRKGRNKIEVMQHPHDSDQFSYIWALFVVKTFDISDIISFTSNTSKSSIKTCFEFIKRKVKPNDSEIHKEETDDNDLIFENKVDFNFKWPISLTNFKIPARGNFWDHVQCFDLTNFITINQKNGNYKWPICSKRIISMYKDSFQEWLINSKLKDCDSKVEIDEQLKLKVLDSGEIIDLNEDLREIISNSDSPKKTGRTILAPREVAASDKPVVPVIESKPAEPCSTEKSDRTPNKSMPKESSPHSYKKNRRRYDYSGEEDRRRNKDRKRTNRKRRHYRESSSDFSKSQSSIDSDYNNYRDRKSRHSKSKRKNTPRNYIERNSSGKDSNNSEPKTIENRQDVLELIFKKFKSQKTQNWELEVWDQSTGNMSTW